MVIEPTCRVRVHHYGLRCRGYRDAAGCAAIVQAVCRVGALSVLAEAFASYPVKVKGPNGLSIRKAYTYWAGLSESHVVVTTYPEAVRIDIDLATCRPVNVSRLIQELRHGGLPPIGMPRTWTQ